LNKKNLELQKIEDELRIKQEEFELTKKDIDKESIELGSRLEEAKKEVNGDICLRQKMSISIYNLNFS